MDLSADWRESEAQLHHQQLQLQRAREETADEVKEGWSPCPSLIFARRQRLASRRRNQPALTHGGWLISPLLSAFQPMIRHERPSTSLGQGQNGHPERHVQRDGRGNGD